MFPFLAVTQVIRRGLFQPHLRETLKVLVFVFTSILMPQFFGDSVIQADPAERPNFILIMADDLGYADLSCYGNDRFQTPELDRMSAEGMRWTDFHSNGNVCSPTRAALLTGQYQQKWGIDGVVSAKSHREYGLPLSAVTFAEVLGAVGYQTAIFGKWHLGYQPRYLPIHQGFSRFTGYVSGNVDYFSHVDQVGIFDWWVQDELKQQAGYSTHLITQHGVDFINQQTVDSPPYCLYLAHEAPHNPLQGPDDGPIRVEGDSQRMNTSPAKPGDVYRQMILAMDAGIGAVLNAVRQQKHRHPTIVCFCSDNGGTNLANNGPWRGTKGTDWEGGQRVPFLVWYPGEIPAGSHCDQFAITFDLFPTLLDYAGVAGDPVWLLDGVSLRPWLSDPQRTPLERTLIWNGNAIRKGDWKLVTKEKGIRQPHLFNLQTDPSESRNLADDHPELVRQLQQSLRNWEQEMKRIQQLRQLQLISEIK